MSSFFRLVLRVLFFLLLIYFFAILTIIVLARTTQSGEEPALASLSGRVIGIVFYDDKGSSRAARVERGVERLRVENNYHLMFVGGWRPSCNYIGSERMKRMAVSLGADPERLWNDLSSNDTFSNIRSVLTMLPKQVAGIEVISDSFHLLRIRMIFRKLGYSGPIRYVPAEQPGDFASVLSRANHEFFGYLALFVPRGFSEPLIESIRDRSCEKLSLTRLSE